MAAGQDLDSDLFQTRLTDRTEPNKILIRIWALCLILHRDFMGKKIVEKLNAGHRCHTTV